MLRRASQTSQSSYLIHSCHVCYGHKHYFYCQLSLVRLAYQYQVSVLRRVPIQWEPFHLSLRSGLVHTQIVTCLSHKVDTPATDTFTTFAASQNQHQVRVLRRVQPTSELQSLIKNRLNCILYTDNYLPFKSVDNFCLGFMCLIIQGGVGRSASTTWLGIIRRNRYFGIAKEQAPSRVSPADPPPASPTLALPKHFN